MNKELTHGPSTTVTFPDDPVQPKAKAHTPPPDFANVIPELKAKLLSIAGSDVRQPYSDAETALLIAQGTLIKSHIKISRSMPHRCHFNAAVRWLKNPKAIIIFGYQNPSGQIWTQHSWNACDDMILDTSDRALYYGVTPADPDRFAMQAIFQEIGQLAPDRVQEFLGKRAFARFRQICTRMLLRKTNGPVVSEAMASTKPNHIGRFPPLPVCGAVREEARDQASARPECSKKIPPRHCDLRVDEAVESGLDETNRIVAIDCRINSSAIPVYEVKLENQQE